MNLSNVIAEMISDMLRSENEIEIQRNVLAQNIGCVPSQINYVLSSRFTPERGFLVESRRGGGGCIRITKISYDTDSLMPDIISSIGDRIDERLCRSHISNLVISELLTENEALLILAATSDNTLKCLPYELKDTVRASVFKQMLLTATKK